MPPWHMPRWTSSELGLRLMGPEGAIVWLIHSEHVNCGPRLISRPFMSNQPRLVIRFHTRTKPSSVLGRSYVCELWRIFYENYQNIWAENVVYARLSWYESQLCSSKQRNRLAKTRFNQAEGEQRWWHIYTESSITLPNQSTIVVLLNCTPNKSYWSGTWALRFPKRPGSVLVMVLSTTAGSGSWRRADKKKWRHSYIMRMRDVTLDNITIRPHNVRRYWI